MVSLASLKWPSPLKFPGQFPAKFEPPSVSTYHQLSTFFRSDSIVSFLMFSVGTFLAITLPAIAWIFLYSPQNNKIKVPAADLGSPVNARSPEIRVGVGPIVDDAYSGGIIREVVTLRPADIAHGDELTIDDAAYAEELQFQETLIASMLTSKRLANNPSSSVQGPIVDTKLTNLEIAENSSESFCGICLENKESWLMFANDMCDHSFCYECTTSHIVAKIRDKVKDIGCPDPSCNVVLDFDACRLMIPDDALVEWDELLCTSLIPESQKMYCPFRDCSALLVNEFGDENIEGVRCVVCSRWFCARCRVPWHADFTCKEFKKLYSKKEGKGDKIVKELAKKKSWQKCPKCKMYVEKTEGCLHITCRCKHEFCYRCGSKWSENHGSSCRRKR